MTWEDICIERCEDCVSLGDNYYEDEDGYFVSACDTCPYNCDNKDDED